MYYLKFLSTVTTMYFQLDLVLLSRVVCCVLYRYRTNKQQKTDDNCRYTRLAVDRVRRP